MPGVKVRASEGYFNPRSPRGERRQEIRAIPYDAETFQSSLPAGGATGAAVRRCGEGTISILAPRGGSDVTHAGYPIFFKEFQSSLPAGGATARYKVKDVYLHDFNPRSPRGERPYTIAVKEE